MAVNLQPLRGVDAPEPVMPRPDAARAPDDKPVGSSDFASLLTDALSNAAGSERHATETATRFAAGDPEMGIHEVMIDAEKASISLRFAVTLKNRAIEAYRELMNTPL